MSDSVVTPEPGVLTSPPRVGGKIYVIGSIFSMICSLARYTLLARFIGPEQLGLAATLLFITQFFESVTDSGADRFVIQDRRGNTPEVQKLIQLVFIVRGVFISVAMLMCASPLAIFFKSPSLAPAIMILALYPLFWGALHLDMRRVQRNNNFGPEGIATIAGEGVGLVATVVAAYLTHSFTAILWGTMGRALVILIASHLLAKRPYRLGYSREDAGRLARFAAPLMLNGLLLFFGSQGDRMLIGRAVGLRELGIYSAVLMLIFTPSAIISRSLAGFHLPRIAGAAADPAARGDAIDLLGGEALLLAIAMSIGFAAIAPLAVPMIYGAQYTQTAFLVAAVGILQTCRFVRLWPTTGALGLGRSSIVLINNIARLVALPAAVTGVILFHGLEGTVFGFIFGELVAFATALVLVNRAAERPLLHDSDRFAIFVLVSGLVLAAGHIATHPRPMTVGVLVTLSALTLAWIVHREARAIHVGLQLLRQALAATSRRL